MAANNAMNHWLNAAKVRALNKWEYVIRRENRSRQIYQWGHNHYLQTKFGFWFVSSSTWFRNQLRHEEAAIFYVRRHLGQAIRDWQMINAALPKKGPKIGNGAVPNGRGANGRATTLRFDDLASPAVW